MGNKITKSTSKDHHKQHNNKVSKSKIQLNGLAKSLFLRHCLSTDCKRRLHDKAKFFKFPVISKSFLHVTHEYKIYALILRSNSNYAQNGISGSQEIYAYLEATAQNFDAKNCIISKRMPVESKLVPKDENEWKRVKRMIRLLKPPNMYIDYYLLNGGELTIENCHKLMRATEGKLSLNFKFGIGVNESLKILKDFSEKIYQLNCKASILVETKARMHLEYCHASEVKRFDELCALLCNHTINKLELEFDDYKYDASQLSSTDLADFPTFPVTKQLFIYRKYSDAAKNLTQRLTTIIKMFPNLHTLTFRIDFFQAYQSGQISSRKIVEKILKLYSNVYELRDVCGEKVKIVLLFELPYEYRKNNDSDWITVLKKHEKFSEQSVKDSRISMSVVWNMNTKI